MLSGIGDKAQLAKFKIRTIVDLKDVGKNVSDHSLVANPYYANSTDTLDDVLRNQTTIDANIAKWNSSTPHQGRMANTITSQLGWLRLPSNASIFRTVRDPSSGPRSSHFEFIIAVKSITFATVLLTIIP